MPQAEDRRRPAHVLRSALDRARRERASYHHRAAIIEYELRGTDVRDTSRHQALLALLDDAAAEATLAFVRGTEPGEVVSRLRTALDGWEVGL